MTINKEDIIDAGVEYTLANNPVCLGGDAFADAMREFNRNRSFEAGAEWALRKLREIDEEELDKLANTDLNVCGLVQDKSEQIYYILGFKAGYRKAMKD